MELSELIESVDILDYISQFTDFTEKNGEYWLYLLSKRKTRRLSPSAEKKMPFMIFPPE